MFLSREIDIKLYQNYTKRIYVRYTSVSRNKNSLQWQCSILVMWWRHVTIILHCHCLKYWWHSNNNRSTPEFLRLLWNIVFFRLVAYLLNMIFLILRILYKILHIYVLGYFLYQFLETRTYIELLKVSFSSWDSQVSAYPLSLFLYSPFNAYFFSLNINIFSLSIHVISINLYYSHYYY